MRRPTIRDLAAAAGVSVATVNRVLAGNPNVRPATGLRVRDAARAIGFYGLGALQSRVAAVRPRRRLGFLLQQPHRAFYQLVAQALREAADACADAVVEPRIEFVEDLSAQVVAARMTALGGRCDAIAVVTAVHPLVSAAIDTLRAGGVPVVALISPLSASDPVPYVGLDNWKSGRISAWATALACKAPGKVGILLGHHRYRCHELREAGFRSYFREHAAGFTLLEPLATFEQSAVAEALTERLLGEHPDLAGLYVAGGGITGALTAVRTSGRAADLVVVGHDLMPVTRQALVDGTLTFLTSHPFAPLAEATIASLLRACAGGTADPGAVLPFEIGTRESL